MKRVGYLVALLILASCGEEIQTTEETKVELTADERAVELQQADDSLMVVIDKSMEKDGKIPRLAYHEAINQHKAFYMDFPKDKRSAASVIKIQSFFQQLKDEKRAIQWRDTLILNFPAHENANDMIEAQALSYDDENYDEEKLRYYLELMLKDSANLSNYRKENAVFRLKHVDKTFDELIAMQQGEMEQ